MLKSKAISAADSGLVSPDFTSFQNIFSSAVFIRTQFIFKPSASGTGGAARRPSRQPNRLTNH